jgi:excisionase family DNA binding protein
MPDLLTTQQAAERLGVSASRVRQFILDGRLPATKLGRDNLIREADLSLIQDRKAGRPSTKKPASTTQINNRRKRNKR